MDLISLQSSWDTINQTIRNNYSQLYITNPYLNLKEFLLKNIPQTTFYIDSANYEDCLRFLVQYGSEHLTIILKNVVTNIDHRFYFKPIQSITVTLVFKHNLTELQTLLANINNSTSSSMAISQFLQSGINYIVPTGLESDYINEFDQLGNTYWDGLTSEEKAALVAGGSEEY